MKAEDALQTVLDLLDDCEIPYMITGSFASNLHGVPRATHDADVVIEPIKSTLHLFIGCLTDKFYVSRDAADKALDLGRMFNVIHFETGFKIDLIIRKDRSFNRNEFKRRSTVDFLGSNRWFASPEDTILAKLEWAKMSGSDKQLNDAANIIRVQSETLDYDYLRKWASDLNISNQLEKLLG